MPSILQNYNLQHKNLVTESDIGMINSNPAHTPRTERKTSGKATTVMPNLKAFENISLTTNDTTTHIRTAERPDYMCRTPNAAGFAESRERFPPLTFRSILTPAPVILQKHQPHYGQHGQKRFFSFDSFINNIPIQPFDDGEKHYIETAPNTSYTFEQSGKYATIGDYDGKAPYYGDNDDDDYSDTDSFHTAHDDDNQLYSAPKRTDCWHIDQTTKKKRTMDYPDEHRGPLTVNTMVSTSTTAYCQQQHPSASTTFLQPACTICQQVRIPSNILKTLRLMETRKLRGRAFRSEGDTSMENGWNPNAFVKCARCKQVYHSGCLRLVFNNDPRNLWKWLCARCVNKAGSQIH